MQIFQDDRSMQIAGLTVENSADCLSLYGSVQFQKDQVSLQQAQALLQIVRQLVTCLEAETDLPASTPQPAAEWVDNPFYRPK